MKVIIDCMYNSLLHRKVKLRHNKFHLVVGGCLHLVWGEVVVSKGMKLSVVNDNIPHKAYHVHRLLVVSWHSIYVAYSRVLPSMYTVQTLLVDPQARS